MVFYKQVKIVQAHKQTVNGKEWKTGRNWFAAWDEQETGICELQF